MYPSKEVCNRGVACSLLNEARWQLTSHALFYKIPYIQVSLSSLVTAELWWHLFGFSGHLHVDKGRLYVNIWMASKSDDHRTLREDYHEM